MCSEGYAIGTEAQASASHAVVPISRSGACQYQPGIARESSQAFPGIRMVIMGEGFGKNLRSVFGL